MPKVSIGSFDAAPPLGAPLAEGCESSAILARERDPIHLLAHRAAAGAAVAFAPRPADHMLYVWRGTIEVGGCALAAGSSLIVERGAILRLHATTEAVLLDFASAAPPPAARPAGGIHILPRERVPRMAPDAVSGTRGGLHADGTCPEGGVWLHENEFPPADASPSREQAARGIHAHEEDEVIFVTDGAMRLGARLCGPGTALAIAADTLYGFTAGPAGLRFVNFRAARPRAIRFAGGAVIDEVAYWRDRVDPPRHVTLPGA